MVIFVALKYLIACETDLFSILKSKNYRIVILKCYFDGKTKNSKLLAIYELGHNWTACIKFENN